MGRLYLIRHGRAAAGWTEDLDPDLDHLGKAQAEAMAAELSDILDRRGGGVPHIVSSPLRRARSTAAALEKVWGVVATVDPSVGEVPSPPGASGALSRRGEWLAAIMRSQWDDPAVPDDLRVWRAGVIDALMRTDGDAVFTSHFVAINAAVGEAVGDTRVTCFRPDYCSRTILDVEGGALRLVELGGEASTSVR
ncbi:MAG TPA: histidine phosphatase family protein [Acidimicrobiales bacterium]|nr:histidine phosphatase family protein [Acidimicrobiales bacterium]